MMREKMFTRLERVRHPSRERRGKERFEDPQQVARERYWDVVRLLARIWLRRVGDMAAYPAETAEEAAEAPPVAALPTL
jgi:hypothetical protein